MGDGLATCHRRVYSFGLKLLKVASKRVLGVLCAMPAPFGGTGTRYIIVVDHTQNRTVQSKIRVIGPNIQALFHYELRIQFEK